jgi:hypothetical protein
MVIIYDVDLRQLKTQEKPNMAKTAWMTHLMATKKKMPAGTSLTTAMKAAAKTYKK